MIVVEEGDRTIWRAFGYENTYENDVKLSDYSGVWPFAFEAAAYQFLLSQTTERLYRRAA